MENSGHLEFEAVEKLIEAVQVYQEELLENRKILTNAVNVCFDMAVITGDDTARQHIECLNEALGDLRETFYLAKEVEEALEIDKRKAMPGVPPYPSKR